MHVVQDIDGVIVARALVIAPESITLQLVAPSGFTETQQFYPAESLTLTSLDGVKNLHALCADIIQFYADHQP